MWRCRTVVWWYGQARPTAGFVGRLVVCGLAHVGSMHLPQPSPLQSPTLGSLRGPTPGHPERLVHPHLARTETKQLTAMVLG